MNFLRPYFRDMLLVLTEPRRFFTERYPGLSLSQALTLGILSGWIAALLHGITRLVKQETLLDTIRRMREQLETLPVWRDIPQSIWQQPAAPRGISANLIEFAGILLAPFESVLQFGIRALVLMVGMYLLVPKASSTDQDTREVPDLIRLTAVAATPTLVTAILGFIPFGLGTLAGFIYSVAVLTIGISTRYRVSNARALGVIFLPSLLVLLLCGCLTGIGGALLGVMLTGLSGIR
jgi:hypothetical protein